MQWEPPLIVDGLDGACAADDLRTHVTVVFLVLVEDSAVLEFGGRGVLVVDCDAASHL